MTNTPTPTAIILNDMVLDSVWAKAESGLNGRVYYTYTSTNENTVWFDVYFQG